MRRLHVFLGVLVVGLSVLFDLDLVSLYLAASAPSYYGSSWMGQMWGGMMGNYGGYYDGMGGMMGNGYNAPVQSNLWVIPLVLIAVSAVAVIGVAFYWAYPELKYIKGACPPAKAEPVLSQSQNAIPVVSSPPVVSNVSPVSNSCEVLLKTMTPEEQKVMNVLVAHKGRYLQKYVGKEAGLSRLKTHRVVARFAQRGIVTVKEFGNTNEIALADWVDISKV